VPSSHQDALEPAARAKAQEYGVPHAIHDRDYIFRDSLDRHKQLGPVIDYYFDDGHASAARLDALIRAWHPQAAARPLSVLEFASGYGCVSRHIQKMQDRYELTACDIHPEAIVFLQDQLGVRALPSAASPHDLAFPKFDVIFALSFFSHMPQATWSAWLRTLSDALADNGILIFTTLGRNAHETIGRPEPAPDGFWFAPVSEQADIPTTDYGCTIVSPGYVFARLAEIDGILPRMFAESHWWNYQDCYIAQRTASSLARRAAAPPSGHAAEIASLHHALDGMRASTSWRLTAPLRRIAAALRPARAGTPSP
jgi:SAM-dependent methyltransferase